MQVNPVPSSQHYVQPSVPYPHALLANRRVRDFSRNKRDLKRLSDKDRKERFLSESRGNTKREYKEGTSP